MKGYLLFGVLAIVSLAAMFFGAAESSVTVNSMAAGGGFALIISLLSVGYAYENRAK